MLRAAVAVSRSASRFIDCRNASNRAELRSSLLKRIAPLSSVPAIEGALSRSAGLVRPVEKLLDRSGLSITVGQVVLACGFLAALVFFAALLTGARFVRGTCLSR